MASQSPASLAAEPGADGSSPCITSQQHLPHHLLGIASSASPPSPSPLSSRAPGASAGRGREQRLPSSSLTASFHYLRDPLRASVSSSPRADPELPLSPSCCSSSSFRGEAQRLLYDPSFYPFGLDLHFPNLKYLPLAQNPRVMKMVPNIPVAASQFKCSHMHFSSDPHSHPVTQVSSCPGYK